MRADLSVSQDRAADPASPADARPPSFGNWPAVASLLRTARGSLGDSVRAGSPAERYAAAHLAALRAAAAVLAAKARPDTSPRPRAYGRPASAWTLLSAVAPELTEWAGFFAAGAGKRAAAEAGITRVISSREADDLLRDAETFLGLVERTVSRSLGPSSASGQSEARPDRTAAPERAGLAMPATSREVSVASAHQIRVLSWGSEHTRAASHAGRAGHVRAG